MSSTAIDPATYEPPPDGSDRYPYGIPAASGDRARARRSLPTASGHGEPVPLELWLMHVGFARTHDPAVQARLVDHYSGYASALARRLHRDGEPLDDLVQVAMEALVRAIQRFDPERGLPFVAYATPTIVGSLKTHYRDLGWSMHVSRRVHEIAGPARHARDRLTVELGRSPLVSEVAEALGVSEELVIEAQEATGARAVASLDAMVHDDGTPYDGLGTTDLALVSTENRVMLTEAIGHLPPLECHLLQLYFFDDMSQSQVAHSLGISQMQVSRRLTRTLEYLRRRMMDTPTAPAASP